MMNGLSEPLDQLVTRSGHYLTQSVDNNNTTIDSCGRQLAYGESLNNSSHCDNKAYKALVDNTTADSLFNTTAFFADNCFNTSDYFAATDHHLTATQNWNQFNGDLNGHQLLLNGTDLDQCLTDCFADNFTQSLDTNCIIDTNSCIETKPLQNQPNRSSSPTLPPTPQPLVTTNKTVANGTKKSLTASRKESSGAARPPKPVSAYALFFRDAQSQIKSTNPTASFGEISKVVASNWEALNKSQKTIYKQRADYEKKHYLKTLASSRAQQIAGLLTDRIGTVKSSKPSMATSFAAASDADLTGNRLTNDTNPSQTESTNNFDGSAGQQMCDPSQTLAQMGNNSNREFGDQSGQQNLMSNSEEESSIAVPKQHCIRTECPNDAIESPEWDSEYCSSDCCVKHCADVFQAWVQRQPQQFPQNQ